MPVALINVLWVFAAKEAAFVQWWKDVTERITKQEGFISGTFHTSIKPESRFNYINVAIRKNGTLYWKAYESPITPMKEKLGQLGVEITPALYRVAFEY